MSESTGPAVVSSEDGAKDFTRQRKRINFRIDGDLFEAARALPGRTLTEFANRYSELSGVPAGRQLDVILESLELVLLPDSYKLFSDRFGDVRNPIELDQASEVILWLLGEYGLRPTQPSSNSAAGPERPESGTNSTDALPLPEHPSVTSPLTGS